MASNSSSTVPAKRKAIADQERLQIRKRAKEHPGQQGDLIKWFYQETGHQLNQSSISKILSSKYEYLDMKDPKKDKKELEGTKRSSDGDWPVLEAALFEWHQGMLRCKAVITGDILKEKASKLWRALPQYEGVKEPKWSNGWLGRFKARFKIKEYVQHGEAASAEVDQPERIQQIEDLRTLTAEYEPRNVLNMDETGLFWKQSPNRTLAIEAQSGGKKSKDRITMAFTSNADGSEKFVSWIIGKSKNPRCLKNINRKMLRVIYRHNKSKWMTGIICEEYLQWLNNKMRGEGRKVLLIMDNFSGHELGVHLVGGLIALSNVRIAWLPPNTTSYWQPMDQGIIASFKVQYRRQWVAFMLREYEKGRDPNKTVTLLKAIQWYRVAWEQGVMQETIRRCWIKSTLINPTEQDPTSEDDQATERAELQEQIESLPPPTEGEERISLNEFINPESETIMDDDRDIFASVVERYGTDKEGVEEEHEEEDIEVEMVSAAKAVEALETVKLWTLQQKGDTSQDTVQALDRIGREMARMKISTVKQTTLNTFFTRRD
jgi:DDE superfamily endonuclease/Fission yeast centromere protein N-terminal domain/Tc5 transposase DNA-binding domain